MRRTAKQEAGSLLLGLRKGERAAMLETAKRTYVDQVIEADFRLYRRYCAAGVMFRVVDSGTYYLALVSSRGYFRLDAVTGNAAKTLVGWTEVAGLNFGEADFAGIKLGIVAAGADFVFTVNGNWVAEITDTSIAGGHLGFALTAYDTEADTDGYVCSARLDRLSLDSRPAVVAAEYRKWNTGETVVGMKSRWNLAETFAATGNLTAAYGQILKSWKKRNNVIRDVTATCTDMRTAPELLFAARLAFRLGRYEEAESYVNLCLTAESMARCDDKTEALGEIANILSALNRFDELTVFLPDYIRTLEKKPAKSAPPLPPLYALLGNAWLNLGKHGEAARAFGKAATLDKGNALYAEAARFAGKRDTGDTGNARVPGVRPVTAAGTDGSAGL